MSFDAAHVLAVLDRAADDFSFPMLDNGYIYLAAIRLSLFRSTDDWALVFERFGYSPRVGVPTLDIETFSPRPDGFTSVDVVDGDWIGEREEVADDATHVVVRGVPRPLPARDAYAASGIALESPESVAVFEVARYLADTARADVLARPDERRASVPDALAAVLTLDEWHHPDLAADERPSASPTFQQLARVLATGDITHYRPATAPNTHWRHWPDGGQL